MCWFDVTCSFLVLRFHGQNCIEVAANNLVEAEKGLPEFNNIGKCTCFLQSLDPSLDPDYFRLGALGQTYKYDSYISFLCRAKPIDSVDRCSLIKRLVMRYASKK